MSHLFASLHHFVWHRPRTTIALLVLFSLLSAAASSRLRFSSDIAKILPLKSPAVDAVSEVMDHFAFTGQMFLFFEKKDPAASDVAATKLADGVARRLAGAPEITGMDWRVTEESERFLVGLVSESGPLLLPEEEMPRFLARLEAAGIREAVRKNRRRIEGAGVGAADVLVEKDPLDLTRDFFLKRLSAGRPQGDVDLSGGYYFNGPRTAMFMTVEGVKPPQNVAFSKVLVGKVREALAAARAEVPEAAGWDVTLLGGYPVALQNESTIKSDMGINILTSIPPVLLMLLISLRRWFGMAIGAVALALGILWTFGLAGVAYGHLTTVTVAFAGLLAGMGIDLTIHMFHRYRYEIRNGLAPAEASAVTFAGTGPGAFIAAITTAVSILCLWVSSFQGLREFGTLVGIGLLLVFAATFFIIPLFTRSERADRTNREISPWTLRVCWILFSVYLVASVQMFTALGIVIALTCILLLTEAGTRATLAVIVGRPLPTTVAWVLLTVVALAAMSRPPLGLPERETDVKNLRTEGDTLLAAQERMRNAYGSGIDPILVLDRGATEDEAMEKAAAVSRALSGLPDASHQSIVQFLPPASEQEKRAAQLASVDVERVIRDLDQALDAEGFDPAAFEGARTWLRKLLSARRPVRPSAITDPFFVSLRKRFVGYGSDGVVRTLTWFTPRSALHIRQEREQVINHLAATAHAASPSSSLSGFSVVVKEIDDRIGPDIFWSSLAGAAASCLLAWILYGSFRWMVVSILPAVVGTFWLLGLLKLLEIKMNYLNLITFPIMTGLATDNGLYMVERFRELKRTNAMETVKSLWPSLTLTNLTTIVGFGSLAFSTNRAMQSLGVALALAMLCYLFSSLLVLPPLLKWMELPDGKIGHKP